MGSYYDFKPRRRGEMVGNEVIYEGKRTPGFDQEVSIQSLSGGKFNFFYLKQCITQDVTYANGKITIAGVNGPLVFTKR